MQLYKSKSLMVKKNFFLKVFTLSILVKGPYLIISFNAEWTNNGRPTQWCIVNGKSITYTVLLINMQNTAEMC